MFRKISFFLVAQAAVMALFALAAFGQTAPLSGKVELKKADGTVVPVEGALIEVIRQDTKGTGPTDKTDKKGAFSFAGLPIGNTYIISVSGPGISPLLQPGIKPGAPEVKFMMSEGDGRRLTPDEVRAAATEAAAPGQMTPEEARKAQAEFEKKKAEVESRNSKVIEETKIIEASMKEGNDAFGAKNWDLAVSRYEAGIAANPTFVGSAPVLLNNKGIALRQRAITNYNDNVKNPDAAARAAAYAKVKGDLAASVEAHHTAFTIAKNATAGELPADKIKELQNTSLKEGAEALRLMAATEQVDESKIEIAKTIMPDYLAIETDPKRKEQFSLILGDLYRVTGDAENAVAEYRRVVEASPENVDAVAGLGLSLVNAGFINGDKAQLQEGANYLQKFASAAPDTHRYKNDAVELIKTLKAEEKIAPQKVATPARRRN